MKYVINGFTKGTVDPELQSKLDQDYKHQASYCKNFYRDKGGYTKRRPPLRLYRDSSFSQAELENCLDYIKIKDVEYLIQAPTATVDDTVLPLLLVHTSAATYGTPADQFYGTEREGTFTTGGLTTSYKIDYRVIRIAHESKTEHILTTVELTQGTQKQELVFYIHDLSSSINSIDHSRLNSFEFARIGATGNIVLAESASRLKTALARNNDISAQFSELPNELYDIKNSAKLNVFDSRVTLKDGGGWLSERYYSAINSTRYRVTDNHQFASKLQAREVDIDNLKIAIVRAADTARPDPEVYNFSEVLTGGISGGLASRATVVARAVENQLKDVVTVLPTTTSNMAVLPDVKFKSDHGEGNGIFKILGKGTTGDGRPYQIYSLPEAGAGNSKAVRPYPLGKQIEIYNSIRAKLERTIEGQFPSQAEWDAARAAYRAELLDNPVCRGPLSSIQWECRSEYIDQKLDDRFGTQYTGTIENPTTIYDEDFTDEEKVFYDTFMRDGSILRELAEVDGSHILASDVVKDIFPQGLALSTANWFGALCVYTVAPSFDLDEILTTEEIPDADSRGITEFVPHSSGGTNVQDSSFICLIYYSADKMNKWGEDNYLFQGMISTEVEKVTPHRIDRHTLQKIDSHPITDTALFEEVKLSLFRPSNGSGEFVFRGKWLNIAGRDDNFSSGLTYQFLYGIICQIGLMIWRLDLNGLKEILYKIFV